MEKSKGGRPRRDAEGESLEKLTIRLTPKLKLGLEMLARAQHRSLSQAVEWALQVGLNSYEVPSWGDGNLTIGAVVEKLWPIKSEGARTLKLYNTSPSLLSFEDTKACEIIDRSYDKELAETLSIKAHPGDDYRARADLRNYYESVYWEFVDVFWPEIKAIATERANNGMKTEGVYLMRELEFDKLLAPYESIFEAMDELTAIARSKNPVDTVKALSEERMEALKAAYEQKRVTPPR